MRQNTKIANTTLLLKKKQKVLCFLIVCCINLPQAVYAIDAELITRARQGDTAPALIALRQTLIAEPANLTALADLVTILSWAQEWPEALSLGLKLDPNTAPLYALKAHAQAAQRLLKFDIALARYDSIILRLDGIKDYEILADRVNALCHLSRCAEGASFAEINLLNVLRPEPVATHALVRAWANARIRLGQPLAALAIYQRILQTLPSDQQAMREQAFLLGQLRAGILSSDKRQAAPNLFSNEGERTLAHEATGQLIRFGEVESGIDWSPSRWRTLDRAIGQSDQLRDAHSKANLEPISLVLSSAYDRIIALRDRTRMREVIEAYESLINSSSSPAAKASPPGYVLSAAADAYLYEHQPRRAIALYLKALELNLGNGNKTPDRELQLSLAYAYMDSDDFDSAAKLVAQVLQDEPQIRYKGIPGVESVNPVYAQWLLMEALVKLYSDRLPEAKILIDNFRELAPNNAGARAAEASLFAARGLPRQAATRYLELAVDDAHDVQARIGLATQMLGLREFNSARRQVAEIAHIFPESGSVKRAVQELAAHDGFEINVEINRTGGNTLDSTAASNVNGKDQRISTTLLSPPIDENFRLSGFILERRLNDTDAVVQQRRFGAGLAWSSPNFLLRSNVHSNISGSAQTGLFALASWLPNDHFQLSAKVDLRSNETPLRGVKTGVTANVFGVNSEYKTDDSSSWSANAELWRFSDQNQRTSLSASQRERWLFHPDWRIHTRLNAGYSNNKLNDVSYFSPKSDSYLEGELAVDHLTWRHYEQSMRQHVVMNIGQYYQQDFGSKPTWSIRYEHEWRGDPWWTLRYGIGLSQHPYNGTQERHQFLFANGSKQF